MFDFTLLGRSASDFPPGQHAPRGWHGWIALVAVSLLLGAPVQAKEPPYKACPKLSKAEAEAPFMVVVVKLVDGDTVDVRRVSDSDKVKPYRVRLAEIDAPETGQPYGKRATAELQSLLRGKVINVRYLDCDRYRRIVAGLLVDATSYVNEEMVARGAAWFYSEYSDSATLYEIESDARDAKRGLWALSKEQTIEPWIWRKMTKEQRDAVRNAVAGAQ